ncbi:pur operon repressor [Acetobacterium bakii]|uniref:LacI family transcriptional regulator n=1 Tax=Acetobacterium bakii TaxID=52689 RepID=A0A0L6U4C7_9FIRM|nr:pur operon repressor [Acetobacterium bakii]KNZ43207.1 LacI family transcriptional regulator [Acetobacterium bakii]
MKKNERISIISKILSDHPNEVFSYNYFTDLLGAGKSSVCEDVAVVRNAFEISGTGRVETYSGATGGVVYHPEVLKSEEVAILEEIAKLLLEPSRKIQGGFVYYSDILSHPRYSKNIGRIIASKYGGKGIEYVVTTETKGIPAALETASYLNVPMGLIRRSNRVTEGATTSVNYISGSSNKIKTMYLSRRIDLMGKKVLIIDDFMKGGGTARGMSNLMEEVGASVMGICVIFVTKSPMEKLVDNFTSLIIMDDDDIAGAGLRVSLCSK